MRYPSKNLSLEGIYHIYAMEYCISKLGVVSKVCWLKMAVSSLALILERETDGGYKDLENA